LLETTLERLQACVPDRQIRIVTTQGQDRPIRRILPSQFRGALIVEPEPKNTAACILVAAAALAEQDPDQVMAALPADHWITPAAAFRRTFEAAVAAAREEDALVTIGLRPSHPHAGLGYLRPGQALSRRRGCRVFRLSRFIEKPSGGIARRLQQAGAYWNMGVFVARVSTMLDLYRRWLPEHAGALIPLGRWAGRHGFAARAVKAYRSIRPVSFDEGIVARAQSGLIIEGRFAWEDLGNWDSWTRISRLNTPPLSVASRNVRVVNADGHLIATVGLQDAIIVHTPDATLICRPDQTQALRQIVAQLAKQPSLARYR